jgi:hypothetical protein
MTKFTDRLWSDLVREHGAALANTVRPKRGGARLLRRPRVLAGSTLGLAGIGTALVFALSAAGSPPAYAVTTQGDGSVLVTINQNSALPQANAKLASLGIHEQIAIEMAPGPAVVSGPVNCVPQGAKVPGPPVNVLVGTNGTEEIASSNTGAGTWHMAACHLYSTNITHGNGLYGESPADWGNSGATGNTGAG